MLDRIFALPPYQRFLLYSGIIVLIVLLYAFAVHIPRSREIADKEENIRNINAERAKLQKQVADRGKTQEEIAEVEERFNQVKAQLPDQKEIPELLRQVSNLGRDSGLEVLFFRQRPPEVFQDLYAEVPVEMGVRGGYHQIALFFDKVRHLDRIVNISDLSMKNPQMKNGQMQIDASFFATTYRFLSEEERERIAKEKETAQQKKTRKKKGT
jgi:type IV pilus assembly protein PilO